MEDIEEFLFCLRPYVFAARQVSTVLSVERNELIVHSSR